MTESREEIIDKTIEKLNVDQMRSVLRSLIYRGIISEDLGISDDYRLYCAHSGDYYDED